MEENQPIATGISSFLNSFGQRLAKGQDNQTALEGKKALEAYKAKDKTTLAEDPNKVTAKRNPANPVSNRGVDTITSKQLHSIETILNHIESFRTAVLNPNGTNPILSHHVTELAKINQKQGMDPNRAIKVAVNQAFKEQHPDEAQALVDAQNWVPQVIKTNPEIARIFPLSSQQFAPAPVPTVVPTPVPTPGQGDAPLTTPQGAHSNPIPAQIKVPPPMPQITPTPPAGATLPPSAGATPDSQPVIPGNTPIQGEENQNSSSNLMIGQ